MSELHIVQPQREGDGRQALVVPPLYPAPAASLKREWFLLDPFNVFAAIATFQLPTNLFEWCGRGATVSGGCVRLQDHGFELIEDERQL